MNGNGGSNLPYSGLLQANAKGGQARLAPRTPLLSGRDLGGSLPPLPLPLPPGQPPPKPLQPGLTLGEGTASPSPPCVGQDKGGGGGLSAGPAIEGTRGRKMRRVCPPFTAGPSRTTRGRAATGADRRDATDFRRSQPDWPVLRGQAAIPTAARAGAGAGLPRAGTTARGRECICFLVRGSKRR